MFFTTIIVIPTHFQNAMIFKNYFSHGQEYRRAAAPAGPLSYCFGITLLLERYLLPFELLFSWREISCPSSYYSSLGEKSPALRIITLLLERISCPSSYFFMAKSTVVQPPLLARLATVLVLLFSWRGISCPSSYGNER